MKIEATFVCLDCKKEIDIELTHVPKKIAEKLKLKDGDAHTFETRCETCGAESTKPHHQEGK